MSSTVHLGRCLHATDVSREDGLAVAVMVVLDGGRQQRYSIAARDAETAEQLAEHYGGLWARETLWEDRPSGLTSGWNRRTAENLCADIARIRARIEDVSGLGKGRVSIDTRRLLALLADAAKVLDEVETHLTGRGAA